VKHILASQLWSQLIGTSIRPPWQAEGGPNAEFLQLEHYAGYLDLSVAAKAR